MQRLNLRQRVGLVVGVVALVGAGAAAGSSWYARQGDSMARAGQLISEGKLRSAQVELRNVIRDQPANAGAHLQMARLHMKLADPVAAETEFTAARAAGADQWVVMPLLGEALLAQGLNREALEQVRPEGPTPAQAAQNLLIRSIAQLALKDVDGAAATLAAGEMVAPGRVEVALMGARLAAARGDVAETRAKVAEVLSNDPMQIDALLMQEQLETAAGNAAKGLELADRAVRSAPWSAMARMRRANHLLSIGRDDKAQEDVDAVLSVQPRFIEAVYLRALLLARGGKLEEAGQEMEKLSGAGPRFPQALYYQAMLAASLGRTETAVDYARRYNKLMPNDIDGVRMLARMELALQRPDRALALLERAGASSPDAETLDLLGRTRAMLGDAAAAAQSFQQAVAASPNDAGLLARYGLAQVQAGQMSGASTTLERSLELSPLGNVSAEEALVAAAIGAGELDRAEAVLARLKGRGETEASGLLGGALRVRRGDLEGARAIFAATLRAYPGSIGATLDLAGVLGELGRRAEAIGMVGDLLAKRPSDERVLTLYVTLLVRDGQLERAMRALETAHAVDGTRPAITAMLADALTLTQDPRRAISILEPGLRGETAAPILLGALARAQTAAGLDAEAAASYRALLHAVPGDLVSRGMYVTLLLRTGDVEGAKVSLREGAAVSGGNFGVLSSMVALEAATAGVEQGLQLADRLRADAANLPAAALLKGDLLLREKRYAEAARAYLTEYRIAPSGPVLMRMVSAYESAGQPAEAEQHLREWLARVPDTADVAQALAQLDIRAKRFADAEAHLGAVLAKRPNDARALNNLAWTYFMQGDSRARSTAQKAYLQAPGPDAADTLGWILVRGGESKAGLPLLQRSGAARPSDPQVQYHLAVALRDEGQRAAAAAALTPIVGGMAAFEDREAAGELLAELTGPQVH